MLGYFGLVCSWTLFDQAHLGFIGLLYNFVKKSKNIMKTPFPNFFFYFFSKNSYRNLYIKNGTKYKFYENDNFYFYCTYHINLQFLPHNFYCKLHQITNTYCNSTLILRVTNWICVVFVTTRCMFISFLQCFITVLPNYFTFSMFNRK